MFLLLLTLQGQQQKKKKKFVIVFTFCRRRTFVRRSAIMENDKGTFLSGMVEGKKFASHRRNNFISVWHAISFYLDLFCRRR
jgi:hypothetical protein